MDTSNYRSRVLKPLADRLGIPKLNFQVIRRTIATRAQSLGSVKDIQSHSGTLAPIPRPTSTCRSCPRACNKWSERFMRCSPATQVRRE